MTSKVNFGLTGIPRGAKVHFTMDNTEQTNGQSKLQITAKIDATLYAVIDQFRVEEDRNFSNMIERLLKTHPRIQQQLEAETQAVNA